MLARPINPSDTEEEGHRSCNALQECSKEFQVSEREQGAGVRIPRDHSRPPTNSLYNPGDTAEGRVFV